VCTTTISCCSGTACIPAQVNVCCPPSGC
jgi:hypothetical protein